MKTSKRYHYLGFFFIKCIYNYKQTNKRKMRKQNKDLSTIKKQSFCQVIEF